MSGAMRSTPEIDLLMAELDRINAEGPLQEAEPETDPTYSEGPPDPEPIETEPPVPAPRAGRAMLAGLLIVMGVAALLLLSGGR